MNIPVSLLPDIAIPEITVQISGQNASARELENTVVAPVRGQLMQVGHLRDIHSETSDGNAIIRLAFDYGANTDLAFIEVNEKIDAAMNYLPREVERPRVIKANTSDIPVFNLELTLKSENDGEAAFIELSNFATSVLRRRFEQLPEVAMIDVTGVVSEQVVITPDEQLLDVSGITLTDIENALNSNNIDPGSMLVRDGYLEYNVRFSSVLRTVEDVKNIFFRKNDRIYRLADIANVEISPAKESGMAMYKGKRAIVLSVIKQSDVSMAKMQEALNNTLETFRRDYPEIEFNISQNQTELLDYSISNLQQNLLLAFLFVFLVSVFFLKDWKTSLVIGLGLFVSLVISMLVFYLFKLSLNVVSLTGLILASGNMIDNAIVVTDNIGQHRRRGLSLTDSCARGTAEITTPMLSSALTNISVFLPLILMSGIAGAIFSDQAFSVTIGLLVSYVVGIIFIPIVYKTAYSIKNYELGITNYELRIKNKQRSLTTNHSTLTTNTVYDTGINWVFSHKRLSMAIVIAAIPLCFALFYIIPKEKMPDLRQNELLMRIDWNENIHLPENRARCQALAAMLDSLTEEHSALVGEQQFLLNRDDNPTVQQVKFYLRAKSPDLIPMLKKRLTIQISSAYPKAVLNFAPPATLFEKIFSTGEADLVVEFYNTNKSRSIEANEIHLLGQNLYRATGEKPAENAFSEQINLHIDREKLLLYNIPYNTVYQALRTAFKENNFATLRSQQQYLPVMLANEEKNVAQALETTLIETSRNDDGTFNKLPLSAFVGATPSSDLKTITAGKAGVFVPFYYPETNQAKKIIEKAETLRATPDWEINFSGAYFTNSKMINQLIIILFVSLLLMYFILTAQFGNFKQPLIVLIEIPIDIAAALGLLLVCGHTLNLMSCIGIVVTCGIVINDSILKVDVMNQLRREGLPLVEAIHEAGRRRMKAIVMTSLTSIVCMLPLLFTGDLGSQLEKPLALATIGGMLIGTPVSLFVVPLVYYLIYRKKEVRG
jgi:multidrug efflux pump subunit AcrB